MSERVSQGIVVRLHLSIGLMVTVHTEEGRLRLGAGFGEASAS